MAKRGFLSDQEKDFIERNIESLGIDEVCKALDRVPKQINEFLDEKPKKKEVSPKSQTTIEKMMNHNTGKTNVTVMTHSASELIDIIKQKKRELPGNYGKSIHKPKG